MGRAAALQVLAHTHGITVRPHALDDRGRGAIADLVNSNGVQTLFFDPATSRILEERSGRDVRGDHYAGIVLVSGVTKHLPDLPSC